MNELATCNCDQCTSIEKYIKIEMNTQSLQQLLNKDIENICLFAFAFAFLEFLRESKK